MKKDIIKKHILVILVLSIYILIIYISGIGCPIRFLTKVPCVTCGTTRAIISFLQGNIALAFYYHPLFILSAPFILLIPHYNLKSFLGLKKETRSRILIIIVALYVVVYIIRLLFFTIP